MNGLGTLELKEQRAILGTMLLLQRVYQEMVLLNADGQEQIRLSRSKVFLEDDLENRAGNEEFLFPATHGQTYFSPVRFDETIREPLVTISVPLYDKRSGDFVSVLVADLRFRTIWELLAGIELPHEGDVYVVDQAGQVVAHRNPTVVLRGTTIDLPEADGRAEGLSGTDVIVARDSLQFGDQEIVVVAEQPVSSALELATASLRVAVAVTCVALAFAVMLVVLTTRQIVRPIEALAASARAISSGDFSQQVEVSRWGEQVTMNRVVSIPIRLLSAAPRHLAGGKWKVEIPPRAHDEIGDLARSFNSMARALQARQAALQQAHDELEVRVEERTTDLVEANRQLQKEITERKRAEAALRLAHGDLELRAAALEEANKELSQYAHVISHDLMAPLRAIHNYAHFLREDLEETLEGDQKTHLDGLGRAVRQGEALVGDLLEFSRVGGGRVPIEAMDVGVFLRELIASLDLSPDVEVAMGDDFPIIEAEPTLLRQIFQNLIGNAIKFNRSARRRVEIGWLPAGEEGYELFVRDNGIGIEPRYQEQVFRLFQRLHTSEEYEGTGIGLAIVSKATSRLHGSVRVESTPGEGSTFFVALPRTQLRRDR